MCVVCRCDVWNISTFKLPENWEDAVIIIVNIYITNTSYLYYTVSVCQIKIHILCKDTIFWLHLIVEFLDLLGNVLRDNLLNMYADALLLCCSEVNATPVTYNYLQISYQYGQMRSVYTGEYRESLHNPDHIVNNVKGWYHQGKWHISNWHWKGNQPQSDHWQMANMEVPQKRLERNSPLSAN